MKSPSRMWTLCPGCLKLWPGHQITRLHAQNPVLCGLYKEKP
jgi:hypothetical protein